MSDMSQTNLEAPLQPSDVLGVVVRQLRRDLNLSQEELGARCSLDRTYVSDIERGNRNPSLQSLWRLSEGLECPLSKIFRQVEEMIEKGRK